MAGPVLAAVHRFPPVRERAGVAVFKVRGVSPERIRSARLVSRGTTRRLPVRRLRAAVRRGTVRAYKPRVARAAGRRGVRRGRRARTRLVIVTRRRGSTTGRRPGAAQRPSRPTQLAGTSTCEAQVGEFRAGNWPSACWRPYSSESPFNRVISSSPRVMSNSSDIVRRLVDMGPPGNLVAGEAETNSDYWHPTYWAQPSDPLYTLHCTEDWGTCDIEGMQVRIPDGSRPAAGDDHHLTVVDQASGWEFDLWGVPTTPRGGGRLSFAWGGRTRIDGDGLLSAGTAAGFGNLGGIIRAQELAAGRIDHALFMVVNCDSGEYVYPSYKSARPCSRIGESNTNAPPLGARFQLDMSAAEIDSMSVPTWKKTILHAMAKYGMYVGDTGGGSWGIQMESGSTYTSFGVEDQFVTYAKQAGVPEYDGRWIFSLKDGVDWSRKLRVLDPCTSRGAC
jgi:hypothetical protein